VAVSNSVKSDLQVKKIGLQSNWKVIYPGVEIDSNYHKKEFAKSPLRLLWIGRFSKIKNPLLAIQAFENISGTYDANLVMIGGGELFEMCKKYSQSKSLKIEFVDNQIMNQLSYEVSSKKFGNTGFNYNGDLEMAIGNTINWLHK